MALDRPLLAALALDTIDDLERSIEGLDSTSAEARLPGFSSISWVVAHVGQTIDAWLVNRLANQPRDTYLARDEFSRGGSGEGGGWDEVREALLRVLLRARTFLRTVNQDNLKGQVLYEGSLGHLKGKPVPRFYWLARVVSHTYYHIGEITTIRSTAGHKVVDFPGTLGMTCEARGEK